MRLMTMIFVRYHELFRFFNDFNGDFDAFFDDADDIVSFFNVDDDFDGFDDDHDDFCC